MVIAAALVALAAWTVAPPLPIMDDGYIALHSAQVLVSGHDVAYGVPALTGATSPPHVALLALLLASGMSGAVAMRACAAMSVLAFLVAVWWLGTAARLTTRQRLVLVVIGLGSGGVYMQITNGLETGFAIAGVIAAIAACLARRFVIAAALAGLLPWLRPDLGPIGVAVWCYAFIYGRGTRPWIVAAPILVGLPWLSWMFLDTGRIVPNTVDAKRLFFAEGCRAFGVKSRAVLGELILFAAALGPLTVLSAAGIQRVARVARSAVMLAAALTVASATIIAAYMLLLPGAANHNGHRYLYPVIVPLLLLSGAHAIARAGGRLVIVALITIGLCLPYQLSQLRDARSGARELVALQEWIDANIPSDAVILSHDAGAVSMTARRVVDLVGLKTPSSADEHRRSTWPTCGAEREIAMRRIAERSAAQYLVVTRGWDQIFHIRETVPITQKLWGSTGPNAYAVYRIAPPSS